MKINRTKLEIITAKKGMTFGMLSETAGISRQNVSALKRRGTCKPITALKLAKALDCDVEELIEN